MSQMFYSLLSKIYECNDFCVLFTSLHSQILLIANICHERILIAMGSCLGCGTVSFTNVRPDLFDFFFQFRTIA